MLENGETAPRCEGDAFHHPAMKMTCVMPAREPKELPAGLGVAAEPLAIEIRQEQKAIGSWRGGFGHCDDGGVVDLVVVEDAARPAIASPPASRMVNAPHAPLAVRMFVTTGSCNGCKLWAVISVDVPVMSEPRCSRHDGSHQRSGEAARAHCDWSSRERRVSAAFGDTAPRRTCAARTWNRSRPSTPRREVSSGSNRRFARPRDTCRTRRTRPMPSVPVSRRLT